MRKFLAMGLVAAMLLGTVSVPTTVEAADTQEMITKKFDFGGKGTAAGYTGVSASEAYSKTKGYGFYNTGAVENVSASGQGALSDGVRFLSDVSGHMFNVDLPSGVYKISVTTGDCDSVSITAEGRSQLLFMTGSNASDSFTIPVTDGQLNIYASSGVGGNYALCTLEIEQTSTGTVTKPTIWVYGDSTVCNYYNVPDTNAHGWGQSLKNYVDTDVYDIRNMAISGMTAKKLATHTSFEVSEYYGKADDIMLIAIGINDYRDRDITADDYKAAIQNMVQRAKAKGMKVYLVKQQGLRNDFREFPDLTKQWYSDEIDAVAAQEKVEILDLFSPWMMFCVEKTYKAVPNYYQTNKDGSINEIHPNLRGAEILAEMLAKALFPTKPPVEEEQPPKDPEEEVDAPSTVIYQTVESGQPITNPHKGFVMNVEEDYQFEPTYRYGIGGSLNNKAWDVIKICSGVYYWKDLNPKEDVYNWTKIDEILAACEKYGMTFGLRVIPYHTGSNNDANRGAAYNFVPQWVYDNGATMDDATYKYGKTTTHIDIPTWSNEHYIAAHKKFIAALAARYDGDPRLEYVEIRAFGNFGEWHTSQFVGNPMPSEAQQKDMIGFYKSVFKKTTVCAMSDVRGDVYDYAISIGVAKRNNGLILGKNEEYDLVPAYEANLPTMGDNHNRYTYMRDLPVDNSEHYIPWTQERFKHIIETAHLSIYSLDLDSTFSYEMYKEQKELVDSMVNRLGYNFTVTSAKRLGNKLTVTIKNTGLASCFFNIDLCAEITDANGKKITNFGKPIRIEKASFRDEEEKTFVFEYDGTLKDSDVICLAMYDCDNSLVKGKDPTVRFDNKNNLPTNRLQLVVESVVPGEPALPFTDVETSAWYYNAVKYVYTNKIMTGKSNNTFAPSGKLTRGMMATILWNMAGKPKVTGSTPFPDVKSTDYYYKAVLWAKKNRVINGFADGTFGPKEPVTRMQAVVILWNYAKLLKKDVSRMKSLSAFTDASKVPSYAKDAMKWAIANKIISGKENGTLLDPYGVATRAAIAVMVQSFETKL